MNDAPRSARALRDAFDAAFAAPARERVRDEVALLAIRVGGESAALRVEEVAGLIPARPLAAVPSRRPELLGVAGLRGAVLPVYGLARLLGRTEVEPSRWFALAAIGAGEERVALAFASFDGHVTVRSAELRESAGNAGPHVAGIAHLRGAARPVIGVPSLVRAIVGPHGAEDWGGDR